MPLGHVLPRVTPMRVGFIGLGRMGQGMAGRLLDAGHEISVHNRSRNKASELISRGATWAGSPRSAADRVDAVITMVADDEASREVWQGPDGVLSADVQPGMLAIECSTVSYDRALALGTACHERGLRYLDAPVTGLPESAAAGHLTLLLGGDADDIAAAAAVLAPISREQLHFGAVGAGTVYKLVINLMGAVQIASAAEGMALAERAGLDLDLVARAIAGGQAASPQVVRTTRRMADDRHVTDVAFTGRLRRKDAAYAMALADTLEVGMPFGQAALAGLDSLVDAGLGDVNETAIIEVARGRRK